MCGLFFQVGQAGGVQHQVAMGGVQLQPQALQGDMNMPGILERHQHSCFREKIIYSNDQISHIPQTVMFW